MFIYKNVNIKHKNRCQSFMSRSMVSVDMLLLMEITAFHGLFPSDVPVCVSVPVRVVAESRIMFQAAPVTLSTAAGLCFISKMIFKCVSSI